MRRRDHASGLWIEAMGWPERLLWALGAFGGASVITVGPYEFAIGLQGKIILAALFLALFWASAYMRAKYLNEIADTPEHFLRFFNPEVMRDIENVAGVHQISALRFRVHLRNTFDRPISYRYEVFDSKCAGTLTSYEDDTDMFLGPDLISGCQGGVIKLVPALTDNAIVAKFRWRVRYWTNEKRKFYLQGAMQMNGAFDPVRGEFRVISFDWIPYEKYHE